MQCYCCGSGSGIWCLFYPWIRDPGWVKNQDPVPGSGSGMNNPDYISESLETIFWVQILKFSDVDSESGMEKFESVIRDLKWKKLGSGIRDKHPGSATLFHT